MLHLYKCQHDALYREDVDAWSIDGMDVFSCLCSPEALILTRGGPGSMEGFLTD